MRVFLVRWATTGMAAVALIGLNAINLRAEETTAADSSTPLSKRLLGTFKASASGEEVALVESGQSGESAFYTVGEKIEGRPLLGVDRAEITVGVDGKPVPVGLWASASAISNTAGSAASSSSKPASALPRQTAEEVFRLLRPLASEEQASLRTAIKPVSESERVVDRSTVREILQRHHPLQVIREASWAPDLRDGRFLGVKILSMPKEGVLGQAGFQTGDIVQSVNGQSVGDAFGLLGRVEQMLNQKDAVDVQIERDGKTTHLRYRFKETQSSRASIGEG